MGKYMRKAKLAGEVAVMEVSAQSCIGVRTRARTLALQRLQKPSSSSSSSVIGNSSPSSSCYLQLRNRRLEKPAINLKPKEHSNSKMSADVEASLEIDGGLEASFGENVLDFDSRDRKNLQRFVLLRIQNLCLSFERINKNTRETTPCSLIRTSESIRTPGSTTRLTTTSVFNRSIQNIMHHNIPSAHEIEEFFAMAERPQQREFIEKYNFDPVNDLPLPGRYEWVKLDS